MTIQAVWNDSLLGKSDRTILVEGNHYFPIEDVAAELLEESATHTYCPWKGDASYYNVVLNDRRNDDAVWYYPEPYDAANAIRGYVAFWRGVEVSGTNEDEPEVRPPGR